MKPNPALWDPHSGNGEPATWPVVAIIIGVVILLAAIYLSGTA